jgi:hypothetical protein
VSLIGAPFDAHAVEVCGSIEMGSPPPELLAAVDGTVSDAIAAASAPYADEAVSVLGDASSDYAAVCFFAGAEPGRTTVVAALGSGVFAVINETGT